MHQAQGATQSVGDILGVVSTVVRASGDGDEHARKAARIMGTVGASLGVLGNLVTWPPYSQSARFLDCGVFS